MRGHRYSERQKKVLKEQYIEALRRSVGVMAPACAQIGVERGTIYRWRKEDPDFDAACDEVLEVALDFAESALMRNIHAGDTKAIKFFLQCKGRGRGYDPRQGIDLNASLEFDEPPLIVFRDASGQAPTKETEPEK